LLNTVTTNAERLALLATSDLLEIGMRRLASYVFEKRTGDARGASHMLALAAPGSATDIAPTWLVSEATLHSKSEHQRDERVYSAQRRGQGRGRGQGDHQGRGGGGKGDEDVEASRGRGGRRGGRGRQ